ncbi:hypothetical protein DPMN_042698 [Dreissena polymorpha]|uniref:Methyltransferase FkbM domain-containing protein n=1 Tax=Dreissena polymorpha TaxID=45954 RepID=A0A9D4HZ04_DREPO|nr:hypothetical protein DPMN_042698 [Dreissena polymorpha]
MQAMEFKRFSKEIIIILLIAFASCIAYLSYEHINILTMTIQNNYSCELKYAYQENSHRKCRFVFLDLGSNKGVQVRKVYEPWLYPKAPFLKYFDEYFGLVSRTYRRQDVCSFGFEANPRHMPRLKQIEKAYVNKGLSVRFDNYAVSNRSNDTVTVYSETNFDLDWGAGILDTAINNKKNMTKYVVPTMDLADFIRKSVVPLRPERILMKMDIEGSEFIVLPHLYKNGLLCEETITAMAIELHNWARHSFNSLLTIPSLKRLLQAQACKPTLILNLDDETYNTDVDVQPDW